MVEKQHFDPYVGLVSRALFFRADRFDDGALVLCTLCRPVFSFDRSTLRQKLAVHEYVARSILLVPVAGVSEVVALL